MTLTCETSHIVEIQKAVKRFPTPDLGTITALDGVSMTVRSNEFITLLGPSGCGKTTFLRCISGFEELEEGKVFIDGVSMEGIPPHKRPVNTVFQNYALFPHLTVAGNVGYGLDVGGVPKAERNKRVTNALAMVNLSNMERRKPHQFSGGQQQRVALARAIINCPKLLLLDEPLSALDRNLRQAMRLELKNLQHELGISFIFVTHDQEEALTMSDRIVVMEGGRIQQIGTPTEIYNRPANTFVARFIGESNLFSGRIRTVQGGIAEIETDGGIRIAARDEDLCVDQPVEIIIRPEHLRISTDERDNGCPTKITGTLQQIIFLGTDYQLIVRLADKSEIKVLIRDFARQEIEYLEPGCALKLLYSLETSYIIAGEARP